MTPLGIAGATVLSFWFGCTVLSQIHAILSRSATSRRRLAFRMVRWVRDLDLFALVPVWTFFAPRPSWYDSFLVYRDFLEDGTPTPWTEVPMQEPRRIAHVIWNPWRRERKTVVDISRMIDSAIPDSVRRLKKRRRRNGMTALQSQRMLVSLPYLALLNHVSSLPRLAAKRTQFGLVTKDARTGTVMLTFVSAAHEVSQTDLIMFGLLASSSEATDAAERVLAIANIGLAISAFEWISRPRRFTSGGIGAWDVWRLNAPWTSSGWASKTFDAVFSQPMTLVIFGARGVFAVASIGISASGWQAPLAGLLLWSLTIGSFAAGILCKIRMPSGGDGADQMSMAILGALAIGGLDESALLAAIYFIAAQACLAYFTSGVLKIRRGWANGSYLRRVLATQTYGAPGRLASVNAPGYVYATASVLFIGMEVSFPVVVALPPTHRAILLTSGAMFHLGVAAMMGLNTFFWAFTATYPALWFAAEALRPAVIGH